MNLDEFLNNKNHFIEEAIEFGKTCPIEKINLDRDIKSIKQLDNLVDIVRSLYQKQAINDTIAWNVSVNMGVLFGEMIIKKHNYKWVINEENIPVIETGKSDQLSPITKLYKIITSIENDEGSPSSFYKTFITLSNL